MGAVLGKPCQASQALKTWQSLLLAVQLSQNERVATKSSRVGINSALHCCAPERCDGPTVRQCHKTSGSTTPSKSISAVFGFDGLYRRVRFDRQMRKIGG